jgi:hypothetical protein
MINAGAQPRKLWNFGQLTVDTPNDPDCVVLFFYHVAPTLLVDSGAGSEIRVIDPALFTAPVSKATWKAKQQDPGASLFDLDASVYYRHSDGSLSYDPDYSRTRSDLAYFRRALMNQTAFAGGPPPYCNGP